MNEKVVILSSGTWEYELLKSYVEGLENKGHHVFFDNYFNSVHLLEDLKQSKIYGCGKMNSTRRNMPTFLTDKQMKCGNFDYFVSGSALLVVKWKDKKSVHLLSNYHNPQGTGLVNRKNKDRSVEEVPCP
ncbi:hypothetical protein NQ314_001964 [Rhamnusium bicolor]|uniref:PiggyBac transposable element-derived protein domain-containing protein n=1 Tax=Rhamnusium bicolor TaxID=1586634 RepID=A0AAV8ZQX1_9CUCU|nr:hypothetical protein NQ314_001964 [Rhamnusium bicolor]